MRRPIKSPRRARCPVCGYSTRLLNWGRISSHYIYAGKDRLWCMGSNKKIEDDIFLIIEQLANPKERTTDAG